MTADKPSPFLRDGKGEQVKLLGREEVKRR
jgi:hypothetical protein